MQYLDRYGIDLPEVYTNVIEGFPRQPWSIFIKPHNKSKCSPEALDLLTKLLQYDHQVYSIICINNSCDLQPKKLWLIPILMM